MADGTTKTAEELEIGDYVKTIDIPNPFNVNNYDETANFGITFEELQSGTTYSSNKVINKQRVSNWCHVTKLNFTDGSDWLDTEGSKYLSLKNNQVRFVYSKQTFYYFDETSTLADNGDSVLLPNDNPVTGRWKILTFSIPDGSITLEKLDDAVLETFQGNIETEVINLTNSTDLVINLDTSTFDYFIINCPNEDGDSTTINVTATLTNKTTKAVIIELRQKTGVVSFDNSLIFPSGSIPTFSGNNKTDLFVICLVRDDLGVTKKRIFLAQKDI
jgi:hypothetical protein